MAIRDNLYNQLSDMQKRYYDQQFSKNYVPGQENMMLTSQPAYDQMKAVYEAEQNVPESSWWNPASWNLFGSAEGSEMLPNSNYGVPLNDPFADNIPSNDPFAPFEPWELGEYGPGPKPGVTDAEILSQGNQESLLNRIINYLPSGDFDKKWATGDRKTLNAADFVKAGGDAVDLIKSGGENYYNLTQPGNPDPWQLANEIWPTYRGGLEDAGVKEWGTELQEDVSNKGWADTITDRLTGRSKKWPGNLMQTQIPDALRWGSGMTEFIPKGTSIGDAFKGYENLGERAYNEQWLKNNPLYRWAEKIGEKKKFKNDVGENIESRFGNYPGNTFPYDDTPTTSEKIIAAKNYNTGTPPEWMVGLDPMGRGTPPKGKLAQGLEALMGKLPSVQMLSNLSQIMPVNERAIMEQNLGNQGIYTDDIGRIVQAGSDYNDPRDVMAGYNPIKMTDKTFKKRTDRIEKTLQDKYDLTEQDIADINAGTFDPSKFDFQTDLIDRYKNIKQSKNVIMQQKEFAKKMADQRRENKKANRALVKQKQMTRAEDREDRRNIQQTQQYTGRPLSDYRMSRPASERRYTGAGKSGMGRNNPYYADGGRVGYANGGLASLFTRRG